MGSSQTGLVGTIGITLLNSDGTTHTTRATANIYEIGGGCYGKDITFDDTMKGSIVWDTGGGSPVYAIEEYNYLDSGPTVSQIVSGVFTNIIEGTITFEQIQRLMTAFIGGVTTGGGTSNIKFQDRANTKNRIEMDVDNNGNRNTVTLDGT